MTKKINSIETDDFMKKISEKTLTIKDKVSGYDKSIISKTFMHPKTGIIENFFIEKARDSVQVFALTEDNKVILVRQFRPSTEQIVIELPGGGLEKGEDKDEDSIVEAAKRELLEETAHTGTQLTYLCKTPYGPYSTGYRHSVMATGCYRASKALDLDDNEDLQPFLMDLKTFYTEHVQTAKVRGWDIVYLALEQLGFFSFVG